MQSQSIYRLNEVGEPHATPCISLYQPTHRLHPDNQQDPIRFRNLVAEVEASLRLKFPSREVRSLLESFLLLADDREFWNHTLDGLAVFASPGGFRVYQFPRPVPELAVVADSFHVKPLVRFVQSADRYQVLCLSRDEARLYEGNRDALDPIDLSPGIPRSSGEAQGEDAGDGSERTAVTHGGAPKGDASVHQGHGSEKDAADQNAERFFRAVDRGVLENHSRPSGLPLVLVAVTENHDLFRRVSHNPALLADGVRIDPGSLSADRLRESVWQVVLPHYLQRLAGIVDRFHEARAKEQASGDVADIARAAVAGRVGTLLVEADRVVPGILDPASGGVAFAELSDPKVDDLLDDLAELVLTKGGDVVVVPADRMPTQSGAAAIYRF